MYKGGFGNYLFLQKVAVSDKNFALSLLPGLQGPGHTQQAVQGGLSQAAHHAVGRGGRALQTLSHQSEQHNYCKSSRETFRNLEALYEYYFAIRVLKCKIIL